MPLTELLPLPLPYLGLLTYLGSYLLSYLPKPRLIFTTALLP